MLPLTKDNPRLPVFLLYSPSVIDNSWGRRRIDEYGYVTAGPWSGWGYAFIVNPNNLNDTISPSCNDSGCTPTLSAPLCAAGTLAADTTYQSVAGLGFNLNQPEFVADGGSSGPTGVTMSGKGLIVGFSNPGNTDVRVQLSDPTNTIYWCYDIAGAASPVFIPWASFNTACWDNSGTAFDVSQPVAAIQLIIPSEATTDVAFNMCLSGIGTY